MFNYYMIIELCCYTVRFLGGVCCMKTTQFFLATLKEVPTDVEVKNHQLMIRAGLIRQLASGLYNWLPLGWRVLSKIISIIREEMNASGALEMSMPMVQPADLWKRSGRWEKYGPELLRFSDRHDNAFCLGPTHEEVITELVRQTVHSYKQLPINLYQIQMKFRDEIRPRFGVMRSREFLMKDAYSFDLNKEGMQASYKKMYNTYVRIFDRLTLNYRVVLADTGAIGGNYSHEFQALADVGEDVIVYSDQGDYAANFEKAQAKRPEPVLTTSTHPMRKIHTPAIKTIAALVNHIGISAKQMVKTLVVKGTKAPLVALVLRGDHELNVIKAGYLEDVAAPVEFVEESAIKKKQCCGLGYLGPLGLNMPCIVDYDAACLLDFVCGANEIDRHLTNVNWGRDVPLKQTADLRNVVEGDLSPDDKGQLHFALGIEIGQVFQLGAQYSELMQAFVLNAEGKRAPLQMGCYGIGISRLVAAIVEQNHDERGIIWPEVVAPFDIALIAVRMYQSDNVWKAADQLYQILLEAGFSVLWDDRKERPGVMFSDMDLIGIPHRLVISEKELQQNRIEYKARHDLADQVSYISLDQIVASLKRKIKG